MKYPSELLRGLADKLDGLENGITGRLEGATADFWNWPRHKQEAESLKAFNKELLDAYAELAELYAKETGKAAPASPLIKAELTMRSLRGYANHTAERWRAFFDVP